MDVRLSLSHIRGTNGMKNLCFLLRTGNICCGTMKINVLMGRENHCISESILVGGNN